MSRPASGQGHQQQNRDGQRQAAAVSLVVGQIGRAHGIRGEVFVDVRTDDPETRFAPGAVLVTEPPGRGPLTVVAGRVHSGRLVLRLRGVDDRTAAEALNGTTLLVDVPADESPDETDEFYDHQLVGLAVRTVGGEIVGEVVEVLHLPAQDLLVVRRPEGSEALVPFVAAIVPDVDVAGGQIVIDPPPGLLSLADADADVDSTEESG